MVIDSSGNLYGTTEAGGASDDGTVFEIIHGSGAITTLASFNGANGKTPYAGVVLDGSGNLFGTTASFGANGTVFEVARGSGAITTLASLNVNLTAGVILDSSGNLYGTYTTDNLNGTYTGTVFEIVRGSGIITALASSTSLGGHGLSGLVLDRSGNLYGTTELGSNGPTLPSSSVFEVVAASKTITTLVQFQTPGPDRLASGVVVDAGGNLFGSVANAGGPGGEVFELPHGSATITTLAQFIADTPGAVTLDGYGNLYGMTAGSANAGTIFELARDLPTVNAFTVNDGAAQRSMVTSLTVRFGIPVVLGPGALTLKTQDGTPVPFNLSTIDNQSYNLTFTASQFPGGSLADGHYVLTVPASQVTGSNGQPMAADQSYLFFRLFGDYNGDGIVNSADYFQFKRAFTNPTDPGFLSIFDYNGDGVVNRDDYSQFLKRFGMKI